jgi:hypothetical protein
VIENVISGMNNLEIAGQRISVQRVPVSSAAVLLRPIKSSPKSATSNQFLQVSSQETDKASMTQWKPSTVIQLSNMTTEEDLADDQLYEGSVSLIYLSLLLIPLTFLFWF